MVDLEEASSLLLCSPIVSEADCLGLLLGRSRNKLLGLDKRGGVWTITTEDDFFRTLVGCLLMVDDDAGMHCMLLSPNEMKSLTKPSVPLLQFGQGTRILVRRLAFHRLKQLYSTKTAIDEHNIVSQ